MSHHGDQRTPGGRCFPTVPLAAALLTAALAGAAPARGECLRQYSLAVGAAGIAANHRFGAAVSVDGRYALVGANRDDELGSSAGAAYLYYWIDSDWILEQKILAPDGAPFDDFGGAVALRGDVAVIGARLDDDRGNNSGSIYLYRWTKQDGWHFEQKLVAPDGSAADEFGAAVAIDGELVVVGSRLDDDLGTNSGSAYVFRHDGVQWNFEQKLLPDDGAAGDNFGYSVAISGDVVVVGADRHDQPASDAGAAYVFQWDDGDWAQTGKLTAWDAGAGDRFGSAVAIHEGRLLVGAHRNAQNGLDSGAAYTFRLDGRVLSPGQKLLPDSVAHGHLFGMQVSVGEGLAIVGAPRDNGAGTNAGAAYLYAWDGGGWTLRTRLVAPDAAAFQEFGQAVSVGRDLALVGAPRHSGAGSNAGAAYLFDVICWTSCPEDLNGDGRIGVADLSTMLANFGRTDAPTPKQGDVNQDGIINLEDLVALLLVYGLDCP